MAYPILASCELARVSPVEYLADVVPRYARYGIVVASNVSALLPAAWRRTSAAGMTTA